jgi:Uma2 family endonuclease
MEEMEMSLVKPKSYISVEDYLAGEVESSVKHEYVDGYVYAMAGASDRHNRIALNIAAHLNNNLNGPCEVFISDMKIRVDQSVYYYPDVVVACDPPGADPYFRTEPRLIIEVISPSTERVDKGEKLIAYKSLESMQEYVIVMQDEIYIEVHRREGAKWVEETYTEMDEEIHLSSVDLRLRVADVYRNVRM